MLPTVTRLGREGPPVDGRRRQLAVFALLLLVFVLYAPSLGNDFVWDDPHAAAGNLGGRRHPLVDELRPIGDYLTNNWWPQHNPLALTYRPFVTWSFALRTAAFGDDARIAHLINVLLHVAAVGLCLRLLLAVGAGFTGALLGALAFGAHALHSEVVLQIVGAAELLAFVAGISGTLCLCAAFRRGDPAGAGRSGAGWLAAALVAFTAAFFSKESALAWVGFAPACVVASLWHRGADWRGRAGQWLGTAMVLAGPAALFLWLRQRMIAGLPPGEGGITHLDNPLLDVDTVARVCSAVLTWGYGLLLTLLPFRLQIDYGTAQLPIVTGAGDPWFVGTCVAALALGFVALQVVAGARRRPLVALAGAAFLGFSFVTSNVAQPVFMMFAERVYFTPSLGLALLVAWLVDRARVRPRWWPTVLLALGGWVGVSGHVAWERNWFWADDATAIERGVIEAPASVRMQLCAGSIAMKRGELSAARRAFEAAAQLDPKAPQPWLELARLHLRLGDAASAAAALSRARAGWPRDVAHQDRELTRLEAKCAQSAAAPPTPR